MDLVEFSKYSPSTPPLQHKHHHHAPHTTRSVAGIISSPLMSKYCSSKWALEAISDSARVELADHGVSVSVVQPAYVKSEIFGKQEEKSTQFQALYGHVVPDPEFSRQCIEKASEPSVTSDAILHALVDPHPRTRYVRPPLLPAARALLVSGCHSIPGWALDLHYTVFVHTPPQRTGGGQRQREARGAVRVAGVGAQRPAARPAGALVPQAPPEEGLKKGHSGEGREGRRGRMDGPCLSVCVQS